MGLDRAGKRDRLLVVPAEHSVLRSFHTLRRRVEHDASANPAVGFLPYGRLRINFISPVDPEYSTEVLVIACLLRRAHGILAH